MDETPTTPQDPQVDERVAAAATVVETALGRGFAFLIVVVPAEGEENDGHVRIVGNVAPEDRLGVLRNVVGDVPEDQS